MPRTFEILWPIRIALLGGACAALCRQTMVFDVKPRLVDDPRGAEREYFPYIPYIQPGT
jgi:hypothetical protein